MNGRPALKEGDRTLGEVIARSYVLAYRENVDPLVTALTEEKLNPVVLRATYTKEEEGYARTYRTLMAHHSAWQRASEQDGYTLICESDFVPCKGLGSFPTFWPLDDPLAWGYLYQGSPRLLGLVGPQRYLRVHCAPLVAYAVSRDVAKILCGFMEEAMIGYTRQEYFSFDAHVQWWLMGRACSAYMPLQHYGEHGGKANPEHGIQGLRRAGVHRADKLVAPLHFLPPYCDGSRLTYMLTRTKERFYGFARLAFGKWLVVAGSYPQTFAARTEMFGVGLRRLLF